MFINNIHNQDETDNMEYMGDDITKSEVLPKSNCSNAKHG